jgi:GNAT superfamily N-acetyltransferase
MTVVISRESPDGVQPVLDELHVVAMPEVEPVVDLASLEGEPIVLLARDGEDVIGYLVASTPALGEVELWEHAVHPDHRHRGVGRALLHEIACSCEPGTGLRLDPTGQLDPERAADYYARWGFRSADQSGRLWATAAVVRRATAP